VVKTGDNKQHDFWWEIGGGAVDIYSTAPFENLEPTWNNSEKMAEKEE
jgi:hypothetical protein